MEKSQVNFLYRFRSIKTLIGEYKELAGQEIYFASPEQLNDPVEGYYGIFWNGDRILWRNLIRHYLLCLERCISYATVGGKCKEDGFSMGPFITYNDLPTELYKNYIANIYSHFFKHEEIDSLLNYLESLAGNVREKELTSCLRFIHPFALDSIADIRHKLGFTPKREIDKYNLSGFNFFRKIEKLLKGKAFSEIFSHKDIIFDVTDSVSSSLNLNLYRQISEDTNEQKDNKIFILLDFPYEYIKSSLQLGFPDWYTACFMGSCDNPSVWGHYANGHRDVCLKFKVGNEDGKPYIHLNGLVGASYDEGGERKAIKKDSKFTFYKVNYENKYPEINFFANMGRTPRATLTDFWFSDEDDNVSKHYLEFYKDTESYRTRYWETFYKMITTKLEDWKYEDEYRIIVDNYFGGHEDVLSRKYVYRFDDLDGIIFGIKTANQDKIAIIKIIESKCNELKRDKFNFYQAYYDAHSGKIGYRSIRV